MLVTKLKNFNKEILIKILIWGILICSAFGIICFYKNMEYLSSVDNKYKFLNYEYLSGILKKNNILYNNLSVGGNYLDKYTNLDYVIFKVNKKKYNNENNNYLKEITQLQYKDSTYSPKELRQNYKWYIVFYYDNLGDIQVKDVYGANETTTKEVIEQIKTDSISKIDGGEGYIRSNITNIVIAYGLPRSLVNEFFYVGIFALIIILSALIIPYKIEKDTIVLRKIQSVSIEIRFLIYVTLIPLGTFLSKKLIRGTLYDGIIYDIKNYLNISYKMADFIVYALNLTFWFILFLMIFLSVMLLKEGISKLKDYIVFFRDFSFKKSSYRKIFAIVMVNFLGILSAYFFGVLGAIVYSIVFLSILLNEAIKIGKNYDMLVSYVESLSKGKFDIDMSENLGAFNYLKNKLIEVKEGLKKAILEEVKSQNMKTELISNVSHDLKTPLTSIITYVDLLKQKGITEEEREKYINTIDKKSQRLKSLIEDLFEVSKANSGNIKLNIVDVDIVALMKQTEFELEDKIKESGLKFKNNFPNKKLILPLDSEKTYRVFENLIINALKYSLKGSRVYIIIEEHEEDVEVVFKNISSEEIEFKPEEISERFVRGDKSRNTEGSGLGLAIAKSFTEVQKGTFKIEIDGDLFKVILNLKKKVYDKENYLDFKRPLNKENDTQTNSIEQYN
ncbi:MAG: histidine kinase dimerization/phospho-acceptor domain-containing protein [Clostridium sp.]